MIQSCQLRYMGISKKIDASYARISILCLRVILTPIFDRAHQSRVVKVTVLCCSALAALVTTARMTRRASRESAKNRCKTAPTCFCDAARSSDRCAYSTARAAYSAPESCRRTLGRRGARHNVVGGTPVPTRAAAWHTSLGAVHCGRRMCARPRIARGRAPGGRLFIAVWRSRSVSRADSHVESRADRAHTAPRAPCRAARALAQLLPCAHAPCITAPTLLLLFAHSRHALSFRSTRAASGRCGPAARCVRAVVARARVAARCGAGYIGAGRHGGKVAVAGSLQGLAQAC